MSWSDGMGERLRWLLRGRRAESDLAEELRFHIEMQTEQNVATGMSRGEARRAAEQEFGSVAGTKEDVRAERGIGFVEDTLRDLAYAFRGLRNRPGFTLAAVGTLALGVGANTAVFSVVNGIMLRPLSYDRPNELVAVWPNRFGSFRERNFLREHSTTLGKVASYAPWDVALTDVSQPTQLKAARTSANVFQTLGVDAAIGRTFAGEDDAPGASPVVVLSHRLWASSFGGDSSVVGGSIRIDGELHTVLGVMPKGFEGIRSGTQVWIPLPDDLDAWYYAGHVSLLFARLAPGATVAEADLEFTQLVARMRDAFALDDGYGDGASISGLKESIVGGFRVLLYVLLGAVGLILLVAGANLANLLLARARSRTREMSMRTALGATRARLVRQLIVESAVLSVLGALAGFALAYGGVNLLTSTLPAGTPRLASVVVDRSVLLACLGFAALVGLGFSLTPAMALARSGGPTATLGLGSSGRVTSRRRSARILVASQLAFAVMLVVGAGLMIRTVWHLSKVDPGFDYQNVLTMRVHPAGERYRDPEAMHEFYRESAERIRAVPGVESVGAIQHLPLSGTAWQNDVEIEGFVSDPGAPPPRVGYRIASPGYFRAMRIPVLEGRTFATEDDLSREDVLVVNEAFVDEYWPGQSAIGRSVRRLSDSTSGTVIGVVGNVQHRSLVSDPVPELYFAHRQMVMSAMMVAVRTTTNPVTVARAVQASIWGLDANVPISRVVPMEVLVHDSVGNRRLLATLLLVFAGVALALGGVGVYGVTTFEVNRRTNEIGIRMALGASRGDVRLGVFRDAMTVVIVGILVGLAGAAALSRFLDNFVFGVATDDLGTFVTVSMVMALVAAGAIYLPARRATLIDPVQALRES